MIFQDFSRNESNLKGQFILACFRISGLAQRNRLLFLLFIPYLISYRIIVEWILGVEIPWKTQIGKGLVLYHGHALVINDGTIIGENCTLRHSTTIGNKQLPNGELTKCPIIGDNVDVGSNVCIIGPITIGDNVKIGAGTVVVKNIPPSSTVVGNPARIINQKNLDPIN